MGFANPQRKHNEFGYTIENGNDLTLTVPELCEEFKLYFNYQWPRIKDDKAYTSVGDGEIWKWLDRIKQLDSEKNSEIARLRTAIQKHRETVKALEWPESVADKRLYKALEE